MKIRTDQIAEEAERIEVNIEPSEIRLGVPCYRLNDPLVFSGTVIKSEDDIYIEGKLQGAIESECSRCLTSFKMPLDLEVNVVYVPEREVSEEEGADIEEGANTFYYSGDTVDLRQEIQDLVLVSLPIKPVCRPECKGLCSQCGADLNEGPCGCEQRTGPSPFDKLKGLRSKLKDT